MKRIIALFLSALLLLALVGCASEAETTDAPETTVAPETTEAPTEAIPVVTDPLELLNTVWASYADDEKFSVAGGDFSEENSNMEGPGKYSLEDPEAIEYSLLIPADAAAKVDNAASLMHMMNANTFTCGAFHVTDAAEVEAVVAALKDKVMNNQWMCGFPDKLVILTVDNCVISVFGAADLVDNFVSKTQAAYSNTLVACDESLL